MGLGVTPIEGAAIIALLVGATIVVTALPREWRGVVGPPLLAMRALKIRRLLLGLVIIGAGAIAVAAAPSSSPPKPGQDAPARIVKSQDITNPNEANEITVWRNGAYHVVKVHPKRALETDVNGNTQEHVSVDASEIETQLPAADPKFDGVAPPPKQAPGGPGARGQLPNGPMR